MSRTPRENRERLAGMTDRDAAVLVPTFNDPRELHCMTQQEPAGSPQGGNPPRG